MPKWHLKFRVWWPPVPPLLEGHDQAIKSLFDAIRQLAAPPPAKPPREMGFHVKDATKPYRVKKK